MRAVGSAVWVTVLGVDEALQGPTMVMMGLGNAATSTSSPMMLLLSLLGRERNFLVMELK